MEENDMNEGRDLCSLNSRASSEYGRTHLLRREAAPNNSPPLTPDPQRPGCYLHNEVYAFIN